MADTAFPDLAEEDYQISSALASSFPGSEISSLIKWVLRFVGKSRKTPLNKKQLSLCILWLRGSREHIYPIKVEGFSLAAKVRDIKA